MPAFEYRAAKSVEELITLLSDVEHRVKILAGGTDLLIQLREGRIEADLLVDVKKIPQLATVTYNPQKGLHIGSAASCYRVCHDEAVRQHFPGLVDAISLVGGVQIQSRASIGGNLCNASPAADTIPALIVHEGRCLINGPAGKRSIAAEQFCTGPGTTVLQSGEFLEAIEVPPPKGHFGAHYLRFIPRNEMDIAVVGVGVSVTLNENHSHFQTVRLALAAVAPIPLYIPEAGNMLAGKEVTPQAIQEAARIAQAAIHPISDLRGTAEHRRQLSAVLTRRALEKAIERARL